MLLPALFPAPRLYTPLYADPVQAGFPYLYKKAGVMLAGIETAKHQQADLFAAKSDPAREKLMEVIDSLNNRYGRGTVQVATAAQSEDWPMCRERLSPCYTTRPGELVATRPYRTRPPT